MSSYLKTENEAISLGLSDKDIDAKIEDARDEAEQYTDDLVKYKIQYGRVSITPTAANTPTYVTVTFSETFPSSPTVLCSMRSTQAGNTFLGCGSSNESTTSFDCYITRTNTTSSSVAWMAISNR